MTSRGVFRAGVAWSIGVWSVLAANYISRRIGDSPARRKPKVPVYGRFHP